MTYAFDDFELDIDRAELRRAGEPVAIEPQVFALLSLLVTAQDRVVSKDEIFQEIWKDRIVSDAALSGRVRDMRRIIGDDGTSQRLVRTVQRRGFRFVGPVRKLAPAVPADPMPIATDPIEGFDFDRPAIAVLPISEPGGDGASSYIAEGLTDEICAALCAWRYFPVIARNTSLRFRDSDLSMSEIGQQIGARYLLSGSMRRAGNRIKLNIEMTDALTGVQIWTERLSRDIDDLIDLEEELAAQVVTILVPELEGAESRRIMRKQPGDFTAWDYAMQAVWYCGRGADADFDMAEQLAQRACEREPDWYLPYTLVATCRFQKAMAGFSFADSSHAFTSTLEAARQALQIDPGSWTAHALAAVGELWTNHNHDRAMRHVKRAIDLNPSAPQNYHFGGCISGFSGSPTEARRLQKRLLRIDPLYNYTAVIEADLGLWHMIDGEYSDADDRLSRSQRWDPRYGRALQRRIALAGLQGNHKAALDAAHRLTELGLSLDPAVIAASYPFKVEEHRALFAEGLSRAGINF
ncbi:winged helix-turn-helix domain-containing protein [Phaeobacter sp. 22II1-1F12B]|uniref:winged helix-turn-helix domain-containing protein n=1 Tax=Phaeobacter sp. 22II1-1F12B TaxID=1317111 RepID=UPI000B5238D9|nr:winged helix-turn-helix domain-containing protein [Phaeobacter sp. 22II1-1F12B]